VLGIPEADHAAPTRGSLNAASTLTAATITRMATNSPNSKTKSASQRSGGEFIETVRTVLFAVIIALVVRTFGYEPFNIPSGSMVPTLLIGDYLFVSKFSYGFSRHSLPFSLPLFDGRVFASVPERGDVVVFKLPSDNETDYIKRIVGLPGDRIQMILGILHINGEPVKRRRLPDYRMQNLFGARSLAPHYMETLPNDVKHNIVEEVGDVGSLDETSVYVVPDGHYFAMGDNRDNSADSRVLSQVGFIPAVNLVGKAKFMFFSTDGSARFWEIWKWPFAIRYSRLFSGIG
jgi:signal peptidase I